MYKLFPLLISTLVMLKHVLIVIDHMKNTHIFMTFMKSVTSLNADFLKFSFRNHTEETMKNKVYLRKMFVTHYTYEP